MNDGSGRNLRRVALAVWLALLISIACWPLGDGGIGPLTTALALLPLLAPLPGMARGTRRTLRWAPLTLAPPLALALTEILVNPGGAHARVRVARADPRRVRRRHRGAATDRSRLNQAPLRASQSRTNGTVSRRCAASDSVSSSSSSRHSAEKSRGARRVR